MELLLIRHAIAHERNAVRWPDDGARPLSKPGEKRARRAAAGLRQLCAPPALLFASPLVRAAQTAALLHEVAGWPQPQTSELLQPGVSADELLEFLRPQRAARIALVGHEPDLSRLLGACLSGQPSGRAFELRKMGMALVRFSGAARAGRGTLAWLLPPRVLRAAR
jgi:phosphohistidine phosphatase